MKKSFKVIILIIIIGIFSAIAGGFYFYWSDKKEFVQQRITHEKSEEEYTYLKVFYPIGNKMEVIEKRIPGLLPPVKTAESLVKEYIEISKEMYSGILPEKTDLNNVFLSPDGILYIDFNKYIKKGVRADIMDEYMFLKSLFNTMMSNLDIEDMVILVDHKEVETLGGHFLLNQPLKAVFSLKEKI